MAVSKERAHTLINELIARTNAFIQSHLTHSSVRAPSKPVPGSSKAAAGAGPRPRPNAKPKASEDEEDEEDDENDTELEAVTRLSQQPSLIVNCTMRDYQLEGLNWMVRLYHNGVSGILADEMGLGKTLQTISMLAYLREFQRVTGPHIILVPLTTLGNWCNEIARFCPSIRVCRFHGDAEHRAALMDDVIRPGKFDVLVTTFEMASREKASLRRISWHFLVVDEAHRLKNENSLLARDLREFPSSHRLLVTGTPLQNNLHELWALLNFLLPQIFTSSDEFDAMFSNVEDDAGIGNDKRGGHGNSGASANSTAATAAAGGEGDEEGEDEGEQAENKEQEDEFKADVLRKLHAILRPFMLRRMKADVATNLPPKKETLVYVGMAPLQRKLYRELYLGNVDAVNGKERQKSALKNLLMELRKVANHPYLVDGVEDMTQSLLGEHLITNSGKMIVLDKLLARLKSAGSRVLIFSQMTRTIDILDDYCRLRGYDYCRIDGSTSPEDRESSMVDFNAPGSPKFIFLLSTRAGGLGINLATADTVVLYDSDWNPQMDLQAQDRAHRIGQKKQVNVYRFVTEDSIEEKIVMRAETKLRLDAMVIQQGRLTQSQKKMTNEDMASMIRYGAEKIFKATDASTIDTDLDLILQRGEERTADFNAKLQKFTGFNLSFSGADAAESAYEAFAAEENAQSELDPETKKMLEAAAAEHALAQLIDVGRRERKAVDYNQENYYRERLGGAGSRSSLPKPPRLLRAQDHQLFHSARLAELHEKEKRFYEKWQGAPNPPRQSGLTEQEEEEKARLLSEGFLNWTALEARAFTRGCERYGRNSYARIALDIPTKTELEVQRYSQAFFKFGPERLRDWSKVIKAIEAGEAKLAQGEALQAVLKEQLSSYGCALAAQESFPFVPKPQQRGRGYDAEDDIFLMYVGQNIKWHDWSALKEAVHSDEGNGYAFNYFIKSRTSHDLGRRLEVAGKTVQRDAERKHKDEGGATATEGGAGDGADGAAKGKKRRGGGGKKAAAAASMDEAKAEPVLKKPALSQVPSEVA